MKKVVRSLKGNKIEDKKGKKRNPTHEEVQTMAREIVSKEKVPLSIRKGRLWDIADINTYYIYYNFLKDNVVYEVGYSYLDYRKKMDVPAFRFAMSLIGISVCILIIFPLFFRNIFTRPLKNLLEGVEKVNKGDLTIRVPVDVKDEIGYLAFSFNKMVSSIDHAQSELNSLNKNLEMKVLERTDELRSANDEMTLINKNLIQTRDALWGEMQLAKRIQTALLPSDPQMKGYEISGHMTPCDDVGGDYYDVINYREMDWLIIGDVSGHGVPAGLIMMMVQTSIRSTLEQNPRLEPSKLLALVNKTITSNIRQLDENKYMTITVLAAIESGKFAFSGMHQDILVYRADTKKN